MMARSPLLAAAPRDVVDSGVNLAAPKSLTAARKARVLTGR